MKRKSFFGVAIPFSSGTGFGLLCTCCIIKFLPPASQSLFHQGQVSDRAHLRPKIAAFRAAVSQSLFHQGQVSDGYWARPPKGVSLTTRVAIPFSSGTGFGRLDPFSRQIHFVKRGRNPFFIRDRFRTGRTRLSLCRPGCP